MKTRDLPFSRSDILFTIILIAAILLLWLFTLQRADGDSVVIRHNGAQITTLPLSENAQYPVSGTYQAVIVVQDGAVYITQSTCPNKQCQRMGHISHSGETLVCAPNALSVTITGGEEREIDALAG